VPEGEYVLAKQLYLIGLVLAFSAMAFWLLASALPKVGAAHVPFWVHEVNQVGGTKTVPGASFWGFVRNDNTEDFLGPFDQGRQDQLDPVNVIFFTLDSSSALTLASSALTSSGWTAENPCPLATDIYAYFDGATSGEVQRLHLFKPISGCREKFHIRLFSPTASSPWVIGAVHHECSLGGPGGDDYDLRCIALDAVIGWEDAELEVLEDLRDSANVLDNWRADLDNTVGGSWRDTLGVPIANDGVAQVFQFGSSIGTFTAYVTNEFSNNVSAVAISPQGESVLATIPVGLRPIGVVTTPNGQKAYVGNSDGNSVSVIDTASNSVIKTITGIDCPMGEMVVHPDGSRVYGATTK